MKEYRKPLPVLSDENREFWSAACAGKLRMQRCSDCGHIRFPISHVCSRCLSRNHRWEDLSGRGEVFAYVVFHQLYHPSFAEDIPYNVALIQLEEGPRMYSNIVGAANGDVKVGDKVEVVFEQATEEVAIPKFRLSEKA